MEEKNGLFSTEQAKKFIDSVFEDKEPVIPTFYIKYGPPASGKKGIMDHVIEKDNINQKTLITVDVDAIVHSNAKYKEERKEIGNVKKDRRDLYYKYRQEADFISDLILNKAILDKYNIAWETTGNTIAWTVREIKRIKKKGFNVTLVYPLVSVSSLIKRSEMREQGPDGQEGAAPDEISTIAYNSINNINKIINYIDTLYIYDNSQPLGNLPTLFIEVYNVWNNTKDTFTKPGLRRTIKCNCSIINDIDNMGFQAKLLEAIYNFLIETKDARVVELTDECECNAIVTRRGLLGRFNNWKYSHRLFP